MRVKEIPWKLKSAVNLFKSPVWDFDSKGTKRRYVAKVLYRRGLRNLGIRKKGLFKFKPLMKINGRQIKLWLRDNGHDLEVANEIFGRKQYKIRRGIGIKSALDLGANFGGSALFFASEFPSARLELCEPVAANRELAERNLRANNVSAEIHEFATGSKNGTGLLYLGENPGSHSIYKNKETKRGTERVHMATLDSLGKKFDLIKFDIEGAEYDLIKGGAKTLMNAKCLAGEIHWDVLGQKKAGEVLMWLSERFDVEIRTGPPLVNFVAYNKDLKVMAR
ncbi:MAG: FkbM family methyltransferase [Candidatus Diapherotrites archaeon]